MVQLDSLEREISTLHRQWNSLNERYKLLNRLSSGEFGPEPSHVVAGHQDHRKCRAVSLLLEFCQY